MVHRLVSGSAHIPPIIWWKDCKPTSRRCRTMETQTSSRPAADSSIVFMALFISVVRDGYDDRDSHLPCLHLPVLSAQTSVGAPAIFNKEALSWLTVHSHEVLTTCFCFALEHLENVTISHSVFNFFTDALPCLLAEMSRCHFDLFLFSQSTRMSGEQVSMGTCGVLRGGLQDFPSPSTHRRAQ